MIILVATSLLLACTGVLAADKDMNAEGLAVKVMGQSGKIALSSGTTVDVNKGSTVTLTMDYIKELDNAGNAVGGSGSGGHIFQNFAKTDFTFSALRDEKFQNLDVSSFDFNSFLPGPNATLKMIVYIFKQAGEIDVGENQTAKVDKGTFKFNVEIENWQFCEAAKNNCMQGQTKQEGAFIEFGIDIKSSQKPTKQAKKTNCKNECADGYGLGDGKTLYIPSQAKNNSLTWVTMPNGYPKVETQGSKTLMSFRFPKFVSKIQYDPTIEGAAAPSSAGILQGGLTALFVSLVAVFFAQ